MNAAQIHLALNHAPLFLSLVGAFILVYALFGRNETLKSLSLLFMVAAALVTIPVYLSGDGTEELTAQLPGVTKSVVEKHEASATTAFSIIIITGSIAFAGLLLRKKLMMARTFFIVCLLLTLASFVVMARAAYFGGKIRHSEIQNSKSMVKNATGDQHQELQKENSEKTEHQHDD